ncbi:hypothetical protein [Rhizobium sp. L1K21]|uniref:hypothetical protein n=1 Tax=Rhizobium sp. L1K21 TaxID=2954933 RepID=UPI002093E59C|nr:hypothetical protein [Rhizobium sp. L1K21]MCO6186640.1 hypothetical protein [Rhizobium sp. L1K21]
MEPIVRRMALIACMSMAFALTFSAIVQSKQDHAQRYHAGTSVACLHPASTFCVDLR